MALVLADRVRETTATVGTGTVTLAGAVTGYQSFSIIGTGNTTYYTIAGQGTAEWEVGIGTYTAAGTLLARTTVLASSNSGSLVNFSAGTKDVFVTYPSEKSVNVNDSGLLTAPAGLGTNVPTFLATPSSANLAAVVTDETGSGSLVFATSPTLTTPDLGTPSAINLANATALPLATAVSGILDVVNGGTGLASLTTSYIPYGNGTGAYSSSSALTYNGTIFKVGSTAAISGTTNPVAVFTGTANAYIETYIYNASAGGSASADFVAYPDNGADTSGWVDVGVNSSTFSDATYNVTGPNEAYVFASAPSGASKTGNLVYATDSTGTANSHQWYVGGFNQAKGAWKMQLTTTGLQLANALSISNGGTGQTTASAGFNALSPVTSAGDLIIGNGANSSTRLPIGASGTFLQSGGTTASWVDQFLSITYIFSNITAGDQGDLTIPFGCTITEWTMLADVSGSAVIDIWKDTYANYPPTVADTITGSAKPTISAATKGQSSTLTGWTATITAGDTLRFNVDSASTLNRVTLSLKVKRT